MADRIAPPPIDDTGGSAGFPDNFSAALARAGIDPNLTLDEVMTPEMHERVLMAEGRERARPRFRQALDRAQQYGYTELASRIENMVETEAQRHAQRGMRRRGGGIGSDAVAARSAPAPAPAPTRPSVVAPPLPVPGSPSPMPMTLTGRENAPQPSAAMTAVGQAGRQGDPLGPIDWTAPGPRPALPPSEQPISDRFGGGPTMGAVESNLRGFARESTGIPAASRAGEAFAQGEYGSGIGNAAMAVVPFVAGPAMGLVGRAATSPPVQAVGRTIAAHPVAAGATTAGATTLATTAQPQDIPQPSADDRTSLQSLQAELKTNQDLLKAAQDQRKATMAEMKAQREGSGGRKAGIGPQYAAQEAAITRLDTQIDKLTTAIETTNAGITQVRNRMSPEYRMKLERDKLEADEKDRQRRSGMTTRELASDYLGYLPAITTPLAIGTGMALRGRALSNWNRRIGDVESAWGQAVQRANAAQPGSPAFRQAQAEAERHMADFTRLERRGPGHGGGVGAGAAAGFLTATLPEEIDVARAALGSPLWGKLKEEVYQDVPTFLSYLGRAGLTTGAGAMAGHYGGYPVNWTSLNRGAPRGHAAETLGLRELQGAATPTSPTLSPNLPSAPNALLGAVATPPATPPPAPPIPTGVRTGAVWPPPPRVPNPPPPPALATLGNQRRPPQGPEPEAPPPVPTGRMYRPPGEPAPAPLPAFPDLAFRRRNPGSIEGRHWVRPGAAPRSGEVETWVSPAGNKVITRDASGNLRDGNRWIGREPPRGYRRIAESEPTNLLAAYS